MPNRNNYTRTPLFVMRYLPGNPSENELTADHKLGVAAAGLDAFSNFKKTVVID
jgi:hypothetical protein